MDGSIRIRKAISSDKCRIFSLYKDVALHSGGIIRQDYEVTEEYIGKFLTNALINGIILVVDDPDSDQIIGEIHSYKYDLNVFSHVLGHLTIAVHPSYQSKGIGRNLFTALLGEVRSNHPEILRVELVTTESNCAARNLYKSLGFVEEGRFEKKVRRADGGLEADIPMAWFNPDYGGR